MKPKPKHLSCARCGEAFEAQAATGRPPRYCGRACSLAARLDRQSAARARGVSPDGEVAALEPALGFGVTHVAVAGALGFEVVPIEDRLRAIRAARSAEPAA